MLGVADMVVSVHFLYSFAVTEAVIMDVWFVHLVVLYELIIHSCLIGVNSFV